MSELVKYRMHIGGAQVDPAGGEWFESFNPYTGKPWALIPRGNAADVDRAVTAASAAFRGDWRKLTPSARCASGSSSPPSSTA